MRFLEYNHRGCYFLPLIALMAALSADARAESFVASASGTLYIKCVGGSAGAVSQFGTGNTITNFAPLLSSLPQTCPTAEVPIGSVRVGQAIPFGIHTVWQGTDYWAFSTGHDQPSIAAFSDVYDSLKMNGKIIQQTGPNTWVMHLDDAAHYTVGLDLANNILIQVRLQVDESRPVQTSAMNTGAINGKWSATVADSKTTSHVDIDLMQNSDGRVVGDYISSQGGRGKVTGVVAGTEFTFELTQTMEGCPGTFRGKGVLESDRIVGSYTGSDCLGERGIGTLTMTRVGSHEALVRAPVAPASVQNEEPQTLTRPVDGPLSVTAIGYRVIPHFRTMSYQTPGHSNAICYGSGTYFGNTASATADCSTVTTAPQERQSTVGYIEIYNQVEANGMVFTLRCTRSWLGSNCSSLIPGDKFGAEVKDRTMWITAHRGGNMGKEIHSKYQLLDVRPKSEANQ
jgi:hypothetical protein